MAEGTLVTIPTTLRQAEKGTYALLAIWRCLHQGVFGERHTCRPFKRTRQKEVNGWIAETKGRDG